ncbi:MAG: hypothetical protein Q7R35_07620 [Elusimicrobiota bacterium]|nr:hypothetical protein [Elusimicrobiota bacterium]
MSEDERAHLLDLYRFQLNEIEAANLKEGEEEELEALWPRLKNSEKLFSLSGDTHALVDDAAGNTEKAAEKIKALSAIDPSAEQLTARLASAAIELRDLSGELRSYGKGVHSNPAEVDRCLSRLDKFKSLKKKYGADIPAVLAKAVELRGKVSSLDDLTLDRSELDKKLSAAEGKLEKLALALHEKRLAADKQIFCITHLPQVAAFGGAHFFVEKAVKNGVSAAAVSRLDPAAREREIARMLGGKKQSTDLGLKHARELLSESRK